MRVNGKSYTVEVAEGGQLELLLAAIQGALEQGHRQVGLGRQPGQGQLEDVLREPVVVPPPRVSIYRRSITELSSKVVYGHS